MNTVISDSNINSARIDYDWVTQRASSSYPLMCDVDNLNNSFILDAHILVPIQDDPESTQQTISSSQFKISKIISVNNSYKIQVSASDSSGGDPVVVGQTGIIPNNLTLLDDRSCFDWFGDLKQRAYPVVITNQDYKHFQIVFYIGDTINYNAGTLILDDDLGVLSAFCRTTYSPYTQSVGVSSINQLTGDITIIADQGILIQVDADQNTIKITREVVDYNDPDSVKTINGVKPDQNGNIELIGSDCLSVNQTGDNALTIQNPCGKPCCTLQQYSNQITKAIQLLTYQKQTLKQMLQSMGNNINFMQANLSTVIGK